MVTVDDPPWCPTCRTANNPVPKKSGAPWPNEGRTYVMKLDGTRSLNGVMAGHTFFGEVGPTPESATVWDVMRAIIDEAEKAMVKVEHIAWINLELRPK